MAFVFPGLVSRRFWGLFLSEAGVDVLWRIVSVEGCVMVVAWVGWGLRAWVLRCRGGWSCGMSG